MANIEDLYENNFAVNILLFTVTFNLFITKEINISITLIFKSMGDVGCCSEKHWPVTFNPHLFPIAGVIIFKYCSAGAGQYERVFHRVEMIVIAVHHARLKRWHMKMA